MTGGSKWVSAYRALRSCRHKLMFCFFLSFFFHKNCRKSCNNLSPVLMSNARATITVLHHHEVQPCRGNRVATARNPFAQHRPTSSLHPAIFTTGNTSPPCPTSPVADQHPTTHCTNPSLPTPCHGTCKSHRLHYVAATPHTSHFALTPLQALWFANTPLAPTPTAYLASLANVFVRPPPMPRHCDPQAHNSPKPHHATASSTQRPRLTIATPCKPAAVKFPTLRQASPTSCQHQCTCPTNTLLTRKPRGNRHCASLPVWQWQIW